MAEATNKQVAQNSPSFYAKFGYAINGQSAAHNWAVAQAECSGWNLGMESDITYMQTRVTTLPEGMLSKGLV